MTANNAPIPIEHQLWSIETVAAYLGYEPDTFRNWRLKNPTFPRPVDGLPRMYRAWEVITWVNPRQAPVSGGRPRKQG